jgi:hypothetical protein
MLVSTHPNPSLVSGYKPLGAYLVEAGLLSDAQVTVALTDQNLTSMSFGEIVVTRGWVKEQTIEYLMEKVILPERKSVNTPPVELESGLVRQGIPLKTRKSVGSVGPDRSPHLPTRPVGSKATTPPTAGDTEGVQWIG